MKTLFLATAVLAIARRPPRGGDHSAGHEGEGAGRRFETVMPPGQSVAVSIPRAAGETPARIVLSNAGGHLHTAEPAAWGSAQ